MRNVLRAAVALVILVAAAWTWALVGAAELASAASQGDAGALMQRIDLPALRSSLAGQITHAYLAQNPQFKKMAWFEQNFLGSVSAGAANELLSGMLTPEAIAALLAKGRIGLPAAGVAGAGPGWRMPPLGEAFRARPLQVLMNSQFDGPHALCGRARQRRGALRRPPASFRDDVAPVGPRRPRRGQRRTGARDRGEGRQNERGALTARHAGELRLGEFPVRSVVESVGIERAARTASVLPFDRAGRRPVTSRL